MRGEGTNGRAVNVDLLPFSDQIEEFGVMDDGECCWRPEHAN